jgi:hypothetical protein
MLGRMGRRIRDEQVDIRTRGVEIGAVRGRAEDFKPANMKVPA